MELRIPAKVSLDQMENAGILHQLRQLLHVLQEPAQHIQEKLIRIVMVLYLQQLMLLLKIASQMEQIVSLEQPHAQDSRVLI